MYWIQRVTVICVQLTYIYTTSNSHETSRLSGSTDNEAGFIKLNTNQLDADEFLRQFNERAEDIFHRESLANWNYLINQTEQTLAAHAKANAIKSDFLNQAGKNASQFDISAFTKSTARQLKKLRNIGDAALETRDFQKLSEVLGTMQTSFQSARPCNTNGECFMEADLNEIVATSRNFDEVTWAWKAWRDAVGPQNLDNYVKYVTLKNKAAVLNGQSDCGALWRSTYETDNLEETADLLYEQIQPLYHHLHAYVRRKLHKVYGKDIVNLKGPIPVPITGEMFARDWVNLLDISIPFPNKTSVDISEIFQRKNYTALKMFKMAEAFFVSLGMSKMPEEFWNISIIEKPARHNFLCHAKAHDFYNKKDFGIKMCTRIDQTSFTIIHHEMGHIQYMLEYNDLPMLFKDGANPGFHEAIGDVITLSVNTPAHMFAVGLLDEVTDDTESDLNQLMNIALDRIPLIPFTFLLDKWRWAVFSGKTKKSQYNEDWWKLRLKYQGVVPPVKRSSTDFDPFSKIHVPYDVPYFAYFVSKILEFQFHEGLCNVSGHTGPLHKCDIYGSTEAGRIFSEMLKKGSSVPWPDALELITGQRYMDARPIMRYFQPLMEFLVAENHKNGDIIGWPDTEWMPRGTGSKLPQDILEIIIFLLLVIYRLLR